MHVYFAVGFVAAVAFVLALLIAFFVLVVAPRQQTGNSVPAPLTLTA